MTLGTHRASSQVTSRGFGPGIFPRVGWCFNTARDFLEFNALTRAGIQSGHAVAMLDTLGNQPPTQIADASTHSVDRLSSVCVPDSETSIGMAFANEQKDTAAGVKSD